MKQSLLFTVLSVLLALPLQAQDGLLIEPATIKKQVIADLSDLSYEEVAKVTITNPNDEAVSLVWDKVVMYQPVVWETQICDKVASYPPQVVTNVDPLQGIDAPVVLQAGESFELYFTLLPYGSTGQSRIEVPFRSLSNPDDILATATFQINIINESETAIYSGSQSRPRLYPNPVIDRFFLAGAPDLSRLEIFNTLGGRVKVFRNPQPGDSFNVSDLPQGVYLVSLVGEDGKVVRTLRLLRREFRP